MSTTVPREMVSCYVRRFGGWTPLREAIAAELGIACARIGTVGGERLRISVRGRAAVDRPVAGLELEWRSQIGAKMAIGK